MRSEFLFTRRALDRREGLWPIIIEGTLHRMCARGDTAEQRWCALQLQRRNFRVL
jgi:hypothetical protein